MAFLSNLLGEYLPVAAIVFVLIAACWASMKFARALEKQENMSKEQERLAKSERDMSKKQEGMSKEQEHLAKSQERMSEKQESMSKNLDRLAKSQENMSEKQEGMSRDIDRLVKSQEGVSKEIAGIWGVLNKISSKQEWMWEEFKAMTQKWDKFLESQNSQGAATQRESPLKLTEIGHKIKDALNAPEFLRENKAQLRRLIFADGKITNAYDLQDKAFDVAKYELPKMFAPEKLDAAKNLAYQYDLFISDVMMVFGVLLRDELMEEEGFASMGKIAQQAQNQSAAHASK